MYVWQLKYKVDIRRIESKWVYTLQPLLFHDDSEIQLLEANRVYCFGFGFVWGQSDPIKLIHTHTNLAAKPNRGLNQKFSFYQLVRGIYLQFSPQIRLVSCLHLYRDSNVWNVRNYKKLTRIEHICLSKILQDFLFGVVPLLCANNFEKPNWTRS